MADFIKKSTVSITSPLGLTPYLQKEISDSGYQAVTTRDTGLEIQASLNDCIKLNYWLRTAHRVHYLIDEREIPNPDKLRNWVKSLAWEEWIPDSGYFAVTSRVDHPSIKNDQYANLVVKDAIADRIRFKTGRRPDSGSDLNRSVVFLFWTQNIARIFIDTSGESLSRRNYRSVSSSAPMQETLAAGIIDATNWKPGMHFINPMTGGGTLVIEAAMKALNRAPASLRNNFGFMHIPGFDNEFYQSIREEAKKLSFKETESRFIAADHDPGAIITARKNAQTAGVDQWIEFITCDVSQTPVPDGNGVVVVNPPYGIRLDKERNLGQLYKKIGDYMKSECSGKTGYVFTGNLKLAKKVGLRPSSRTTFFNSTVECRLFEYPLYSGSKKK